jgi:transcriptional regulator with XRE-family HTH domain
MDDPIVPVQCWMAREALGWSGYRLARAAQVSPETVARFERGVALKEITVEVIRLTFERAGVVFVHANDGGPGARLRSSAAAKRER